MATTRRGSAGPAARTIPGVDVASFQGPPGTWSTEAGGIVWAAVKLTELQPGNIQYVNPEAAADWAFIGQQKLGRIAYLYGHPSVSPGDTVSFFVSELLSLGLGDGDGLMLDLEVTDGLSPGEVSAWANAVMSGLRSTLNRTPILYT